MAMPVQLWSGEKSVLSASGNALFASTNAIAGKPKKNWPVDVSPKEEVSVLAVWAVLFSGRSDGRGACFADCRMASAGRLSHE